MGCCGCDGLSKSADDGEFLDQLMSCGLVSEVACCVGVIGQGWGVDSLGVLYVIALVRFRMSQQAGSFMTS